jgi:methylated-DNA-[protein]-cysteine S-methyltransferase
MATSGGVTFYAQLSSPLGQILLCTNDAHLTGLYFIGQKDCPSIEGLPATRPDARDPTSGTLAGRPIKNFRVCASAPGDLFRDEGNGNSGRGPGLGAWTPLQAGTPDWAQTIFDWARRELDEYFTGKRTVFSVPLAVSGTPFQKKVWAALQTIPYGEVVSYADVARQAGYAAGYGRPVGTAVGRNPLTVIIPCHRVLSSAGRLNGYTGGLARKFALLKLEGCALVAA